MNLSIVLTIIFWVGAITACVMFGITIDSMNSKLDKIIAKLEDKQ